MPATTPYDLKIACWHKPGVGANVAENLADCKDAPLVWVHIHAHDRGATAKLLSEEFGFHELEIEDALTEGERPHLHENENHLFFTAPAIRVEEIKVYFTEVGCFLSKGRLVTVATEPVSILENWHERICARAATGIRDASRLLYMIIDALVDDYYPAMDMLEDVADGLESDVFGGRVVPIKDLLRVKRRLLEIRRRISPFRDILNGLLRHDIPMIAKSDRIYFQDVYDHVLRILEHADLNRDILASILDANLATVSNRLNETMKILTVASVILMSAALVAGVYGMNFKHMPELDWMWGYPFAIGLMLVIGLVQLWVFRRKKML